MRRDLPFFDLLNSDLVAGLKAEVDWIVQMVGIAFRDDPKALEIRRKAGLKPERDLMKAPADWIRAPCRRAQSEFTQRVSNSERSVCIGGGHQVFASIYSAPFVRDLKKGRRNGDLDSFTKLLKLVQMIPSLHHSGLGIVDPCDVPASKRHLEMVYAHMRVTDKPHLSAITQQSHAQDSVDMARILYGKDAIETQGVILGNTNANSLLLVDKVVSEAIRTYC